MLEEGGVRGRGERKSEVGFVGVLYELLDFFDFGRGLEVCDDRRKETT